MKMLTTKANHSHVLPSRPLASPPLAPNSPASGGVVGPPQDAEGGHFIIFWKGTFLHRKAPEMTPHPVSQDALHHAARRKSIQGRFIEFAPLYHPRFSASFGSGRMFVNPEVPPPPPPPPTAV